MKLFGLGVNIAGRGEYPVPLLLQTGLRSARFPLYPDVNIKRYILELTTNSITPILVVARESVELFPNWPAAFAHYRHLYGDIPGLMWQLGNEADHESDSSWTLRGADVNRLAITALNTLGPKVYLGPGLVSGDPTWIEREGLNTRLFNALAIHPYAKAPDADDTREMLTAYRWRAANGGLGLVATEFHARALGMAAYLNRELDGACAFCFSDTMVPSFGLFEHKPSWQSFVSATDGPRSYISMDAPEPPQFVLGFKAWHDLEPDIIGEPEENEYGPWMGVSSQRTTTGFIHWAESDRFWFEGRDGVRRRWRPGMERSEVIEYEARPT